MAILNTSTVLAISPKYNHKSLKQANVNPIFKAGDKSNIGNYRPISQCNPIATILETVLNTRIYKFAEKNNIISSPMEIVVTEMQNLKMSLIFSYCALPMQLQGNNCSRSSSAKFPI